MSKFNLESRFKKLEYHLLEASDLISYYGGFCKESKEKSRKLQEFASEVREWKKELWDKLF